MFVKPKEGLHPRNPVTMLVLPAEGAEVPESNYWLRRVKDGDVVVCKPPKADKKAEGDK